MEYLDKSIGFAPDLVPLVQDGSKTLTYRLGKKWSFLEVGDTIKTDDSGTGETFGVLRILSRQVTTFGEIPIDREGHEKYESKEDQRAKFMNYYQREVEDTEPVTVLEFALEEAH